MRVLDRYIATEFFKVFGVCSAGFILIFLLIELTDKIKNYFQYDPSPGLMALYFLVKTPGYLLYVAPLSILMGGMLSLLMMARHYEIIALQANGIDAIEIARPVLFIGLLASGAMFLANETVIPWSNWYSEYIEKVLIRGESEQTFFNKGRIWMRSPDSMTYIEEFREEEGTLHKVTVVRWDDRYRFQSRLHAEKAVWMKDHWLYYGVNLTRKDQNGEYRVKAYPSMVAALTKPPSEFGQAERPAKEMNLFQLGDYIKKLKEEGHRPTHYLVDWHDKIAFPLVCLVMAALSVPVAVNVRPGGGGFAIGLVLSIAVAFSYWIVHTMFISLGHGGYVPPIVAAWAPNVVFGLGALTSLLHSGT